MSTLWTEDQVYQSPVQGYEYNKHTQKLLRGECDKRVLWNKRAKHVKQKGECDIKQVPIFVFSKTILLGFMGASCLIILIYEIFIR